MSRELRDGKFNSADTRLMEYLNVLILKNLYVFIIL